MFKVLAEVGVSLSYPHLTIIVLQGVSLLCLSSGYVFLLLLNLFQEAFEVIRLLLEELNLFLTRLRGVFAVLFDDALDGFNLGTKFRNTLQLLLLLLFQVTLGIFELGTTMLRLQLLTCGKSDGAAI